MIFVFYFFAFLQILSSISSLRGGFRFLRFFRSSRIKAGSNYEPFATVIVPCRGRDKDLERNLGAVVSQEYTGYEVIFVIDDEDDAAASVIRDLLDEGPGRRVVIAGRSEGTGQKVHNLIKAVARASDKSELFVFVDSDARPGPFWLRQLAAPLDDAGIGCATGYRWFVQKKGGFATHLLSVWNASIASALGPEDGGNFCWGGSTAIRREVFERLEVAKAWKGTLSDDFTLTRCLKDAGLGIRFVPACLTATVGDFGFRELFEFTTRQMKITRVYSPDLWLVSLLGSALFAVTFFGAGFLLFVQEGIHFGVIAAFIGIVLVSGTLKAYLRLKAVRMILTDLEPDLRRQVPFQLSLWTITPIIFLYNDLVSQFSRRIVWRGIEYILESRTSTKIVNNDGQ